MRAAWILAIFVTIALAAAPRGLAEQPVDVKSPLSPEESLTHFQIDPLLSIELVAAEPQVVDPVAMRFDEDGRLWVAEMRDYPLGPIKKTDGKRTEKDAEPLSQIKILEDKDGDGRFETATVFADKLLFVTGLQPWKGGVIVTLSGKVAYMKDTDGDGKADVNETWFTGFSESNSQLRANHPTFALDNHIYVANGLRGGMVVNHLKKLLASGGRKPPDTKEKETGDRKQETDDKPINISGMDFRFDPLTGDAEAVSGNGQFGLCFDDWGNRFVCSNRNPCQHVVIENRYLKKAPTVAIPSVVQDVAAFAENSRIYPISKFWTTSNLHEGQFTAACGVFIYRGDLLPQQFRGNVFTCDPTGNLIHREIMEAKGATFTSKPAYEGKEFLASPDTWFRPVSMEHGPDGALYVVDMYRAVIEHPEWVPDELKNRPDERLGDDRGRIYRIKRAPSQELSAQELSAREGLMRARGADELEIARWPRLKNAAPEKLVKLLRGNAWRRETVQRLFLENRYEKSEELLRAELTERHATGFRLAQILWMMKGLGIPIHNADLDAKRILQYDRQAQWQWLRVFDGRLSSYPELVTTDRGKLMDYSGLGFSYTMSRLVDENPESIPIPYRSLSTGDVWVERAILLAANDKPDQLLLELTRQHGFQSGAKGRNNKLMNFSKEVAFQVGATIPRERIIPLLKEMSDLATRVCFKELARGFRRRGPSIESLIRESGDERLLTLVKSTKEEAATVNKVDVQIMGMDAFVKHTAAKAELLGYFENTTPQIERFLDRSFETDIRVAAIHALAWQDAQAMWVKLCAEFAMQPPLVRQAILDGVLQRPERISLLLDSLESGSIKPTELDLVQTGRLLKHGDAKIRERAEKIFGSATPEDRKKALSDYQSVLTMTGDAKRGQVSFAKNCATCHKIGETGVNVAPDISDSRTKTPAQILADIIQPNRAIDANYVAYNLLLADGTTASGILTSETSTSITLKAAGAKVITVARGEIEQLKSTGVSLMPEGLEKTIPLQEMADVIAFIKNWRYLDGRVPVK